MTALDIQARKDRAVFLADRAKRLQTALDHTTAIRDDADLLHYAGLVHLDGLRDAIKDSLRIVSDAAKDLDRVAA